MFSYTCKFCNKQIKVKRKRHSLHQYCSKECDRLSRFSLIDTVCKTCNKNIKIRPGELKKSKSGFSFCSKSCSAKHNNANRTGGCSRSKIEIKFGQELQKLFPDLEFLFNSKIEGYEIDIYIPSIKLAIEWNGKVHYQPIYGEEKLNNIQYRDYQKQLICQKLGIDLIVICDLTSRGDILEKSINKVKSIIELK